ncbi:MAG: hypothetical protein ACREDV_10820 [Methylocella sp.]
MANSAAHFDTLGQTPVRLKASSGTLLGYDAGNSDTSPQGDGACLQHRYATSLSPGSSWYERISARRRPGLRSRPGFMYSSRHCTEHSSATLAGISNSFSMGLSQMVKLRAPDGISSIVHVGNEIEIADDRSVEVDEFSAGEFEAHGFRPWNDFQSAKPIDAMPRLQTVLDILKGAKCTLEAPPAEEFRAGVPAAAPDTTILRDGTGTRGEHEQEQDISSLNRPALFAFLRAKGVSVSLPITNEELRAVARRARER